MSATAPTEGHEDLLLGIQDLQARLDATTDSATRETAEQLVAAVVRMYGAGLQRILAMLGEDGEQGQRLAAGIAQDELVAPLLLIHDIHPVPLPERVLEALERVRPYMESHGGNVELLGLRDGVARISLHGSCSDCTASAVTLELAIKQALEATAPDLEGLEVEGIAPPSATLHPPPAGPSLPFALGCEGSASGAFELPMAMSSPSESTSAGPARAGHGPPNGGDRQ